MQQPRTLALAAVLVLATPAAAQVPQEPADVPVFPGAMAIEAAAPDLEAIGSVDQSSPIELLDQGHLAWEVEATPEEVFAWYLARIPSEEMEDGGSDWWPMAGEEFSPFHIIQAHDLHRAGDGDVHSGAQIRAALVAAGRQPVRPDVYVQDAAFAWSVPGPGAGEHVDFQLRIVDDGLFYRDTHWTSINLQWSRYLAGEAAAEFVERAEDEEDQRIYAERSSEMGGAPSVEQLGVGAYAGARYDAQLSVAMSSDENARSYVFFTDDDGEAVRTFYEAETGLTATDVGGGTYVIAIEGPAMMPEHGIMIGSTAGSPYASRGRTMFMIRVGNR